MSCNCKQLHQLTLRNEVCTLRGERKIAFWQRGKSIFVMKTCILERIYSKFSACGGPSWFRLKPVTSFVGKWGGNGAVPPPPYFFGSNFFLREYFLLKFSGWSRTRMIRPKMHSFCENRKFGGTPSPNFHPWWISKFTEKWKNRNRRIFITKSDWWPCINVVWRVARGSRLVLGILQCLRMHFWPVESLKLRI